MPRRRTRTSVLKPKLHFTESPVQGENKPVSPVLGAENPVTAKTVPLEDHSDISWISPNFKEVRNKLHTDGHKRNLRLRKSSVPTARRHTSSKQFHYHQENNSVTGRRLQNKKCKFKPLIFIQDNDGKEEEYDISVQTSPVLGRKQKKKDKSFQNSDVSFHTPVSHDLNSTSQKKQHSSCYSSHEKVNQNKSHQNFTNVHYKLNKMKHGLWKATASPEFHCSGTLDTPSVANSSYLHNELCDTPKSRNLRRSSRLREKYLEAVKLFQTSSPKNNCNTALTVLAEDTPESEYHLRLKRRQMRKLVQPE